MFDLGITEDQELECQKQEKENKEMKKKTKIMNCHCIIQQSQEKRILSNAHIM